MPSDNGFIEYFRGTHEAMMVGGPIGFKKTFFGEAADTMQALLDEIEQLKIALVDIANSQPATADQDTILRSYGLQAEYAALALEEST